MPEEREIKIPVDAQTSCCPTSMASSKVHTRGSRHRRAVGDVLGHRRPDAARRRPRPAPPQRAGRAGEVDAQGRRAHGGPRRLARGDRLHRTARQGRPRRSSTSSAPWSAMWCFARLLALSPTGTQLISWRAATRRAEVADDRVSVRSDDHVVETFREVEVELFDADDALIDAVMARLAAAGVRRAGEHPEIRSGTPRARPHDSRPAPGLSPRASLLLRGWERGVARSTRAALPSRWARPLGTIPLAGIPPQMWPLGEHPDDARPSSMELHSRELHRSLLSANKHLPKTARWRPADPAGTL